MERFRKWLGWTVGVVMALLIGVWLSLAPGDPALYPGEAPGIEVTVINHGWHSGLVLRPIDLIRIADGMPEEAAGRLRWLAAQARGAPWIEVGWGDRAFYQVTPTLGDLDPWLAVRAIAWPTPSVLQVVPGQGQPAAFFRGAEAITLTLSTAGFRRLALTLAETVIPGPAIGPSLYGQGAFYGAAPPYHLFRTCNHWISSLLRAAGVPSSGLPATFSAGLMAELQWRGI
ncbi:MAG: DUF2459 domain-containing protein [Pseudomonadota bacterium]